MEVAPPEVSRASPQHPRNSHDFKAPETEEGEDEGGVKRGGPVERQVLSLESQVCPPQPEQPGDLSLPCHPSSIPRRTGDKGLFFEQREPEGSQPRNT